MDRIGPAGGSPTTALTNGQQGFINANLSSGQVGTTVVANFLNAVQEELMSILAAAGTTPNIANFGQVLLSLQTLFGGGGSIASNGWQKLPGGLIIQWGSSAFPITNGTTAGEVVTFPTTFPNAAFYANGCVETSANSASGDQPTFGRRALTVSTCQFGVDDLGGYTSPAVVINQVIPFNYFALGY